MNSWGIELSEKRGKLVSILDVEKKFLDLALTTKARTMAIGPRLAAELVGETQRNMILAKIEKEIRTALLHIERLPHQRGPWASTEE